MNNVNISGAGRSQVNINGMSIIVENGRLTVNGKLYGPLDGSAPTAPPTPDPVQELKLTVDGRIEGYVGGPLNVTASGKVTLIVKGDIGGDVSVINGDLDAANISGDIRAQGDVKAGNISGDVSAGGHVTAHIISGDVRSERGR